MDQVLKAQSDAAEVFESATNGLGRPAGGSRAVEVEPIDCRTTDDRGKPKRSETRFNVTYATA